MTNLKMETFKDIVHIFMEVANLRPGEDLPDNLWAHETRKLLKKIINLARKIDIIIITPNALADDDFVNGVRDSILKTLYIVSNRFDDSVDPSFEYSNILFSYNSDSQWMTISGIESYNFLLTLAFSITDMRCINECLSCGNYMVSFNRHERKTCGDACRQRLFRRN